MARRPLVLVGLAAAAAASAFVVWCAAFALTLGRRLDGSALATFFGVSPPPLTPGSVHGVAELAGPLPFALGAGALVVAALLRRRWLMAAVVPAILLSANLATQWLKPALTDPRVVDLHGLYEIFPGSWPSGHSTAAMSLALCLVLVAGPRLRRLAALLGAGYAIAVGYALLVAGSHLPSDVIGGYLVAATFTLLGAAALAGAEARWPAVATGRRSVRPPSMATRGWQAPPPPSAPALAGLASLLASLAFVAVMVRRPGTPVDLLEHPTAVLAGIGIAGFGLVLTFGLAQVLRR